MRVLFPLTLVAVAAGHASMIMPPSRNVKLRLLPLGDSITFGCGDQCEKDKDCMKNGAKLAPCSSCSGGYRTQLWHAVQDNYEFVGTQSNGPPDIGRNHEGHPGWTITQIHGILGNWSALSPDAILLHLGTNDLGGYVKPVPSPAEAADRMDALLNATFEALPKVERSDI